MRRWWKPAFIVMTALSCAAWFLTSEHVLAGRWGFSLDDSWIYATFAKNLALGKGYAFNPGEHIAGATGPLYVFILALFHLMFRDIVLPAKVLGILCLCASSLVLYAAVRRVAPESRLAPLLAGVLLAASPPLLWGAVSGMEIPVYLLFICIGIYGYVREKWTLAVLCWSLGVWLRPDGLFLVALGLFARPGLTIRGLLGPVLVAVLVVGAYFGFNEVVGGRLLPNSVGVKANLGGNLLASQWRMLGEWADLWGISAGRESIGFHAPLLLPGIAVGSVLAFRRLPAFVAYLFLFPVAFGVIGSSGQFARYIVHVVPFGIVLGVLGFVWICRRAWGRRLSRGLAVIGLICLGWQLSIVRLVGIAHGWNVDNINGMQRTIAEVAQQSTAPGDTIAVNDVGAIGYFSGCYVVDLVGLVSPPRSFPENLRVYHPKYLVIFPDWFRDFAVLDPGSGQYVFYGADSVYKYSPFLGVGLKKNTIAARNTMYLYERLDRNETGVSKVQLYVH